jgi:hypothetical protein
MMIYTIGATTTFAILLVAFLKDRSTPKTHLWSWFFLLVASSLWFITLPQILRRQFGAQDRAFDSFPQAV